MRMSEFERPENEKGKDLPLFSTSGPAVPNDFTEEDLTFAAELHALFSPEEESLPPYYVQTLLDVDDQRFEPVVRGFEYKTIARVFRRLKLRRRIFRAPVSPVNALRVSLGDASLRRSALAMVGSFMLIMLLTVAFTGSSFASGVAFLLHGTHGIGVYEVNQYPNGIVQHARKNMFQSSYLTHEQISLLTVQQELHFPIYWPGYIPPEYMLQHINFYVGLDQQWADGPLLEFEFRLPASAPRAAPAEHIWVREFKPRTDVLQLVGDGASVPIAQDANGRAQAIYVNGQWDVSSSDGPSWKYGTRSELIYQIDGIVFWIANYQSADIGEKELMQVAQGLTLCCVVQHVLVADDTTPVTQMGDDSSGPFTTDIIMIFASDGNDRSGPYYMSVTSSQLPQHAY